MSRSLKVVGIPSFHSRRFESCRLFRLEPLSAGGWVAGAILVSLLGFSSELASSSEVPASRPRGSEFALPTEPEDWRFVDTRSERAPPALRALSERTGVVWSAVWDPALEVPYFAFPHESCRLSSSEALSTKDAVAAAAGAFLERHKDVFGVGPEKLSPLEVYSLGDGYHVTAAQVHAGIPARGALFRMRVNGDGTIRSVGSTVARELPQLEAVEFGKAERQAWAERGKEGEGLAEILSVRPWILFPQGVSSARAGVVVIGLDRERRELEISYTLEGDVLLVREKAVGFDGEMGHGAGCDQNFVLHVQVHGLCPDPKNPYRVPGLIEGRYALPRARIRLEQDRCVVGAHWHLSPDGYLDGAIASMLEPAPYTVHLDFHDTRFLITEGDAGYTKFSFEHRGDLHWDRTFNTEKTEFGSFHLFVYHHLHNCVLQTADLVDLHGLYFSWRDYDEVNTVELDRTTYEHSYSPESGRWVFKNDEIVEVQQIGRYTRLRKITPTIIYHEYGHEFVKQLANTTTDADVVEGVADAFATYMAKASMLGYDNTYNPVADKDARDLREDMAVYPVAENKDKRRAVAGALWELWEATREPLDFEHPDPVDLYSHSPFAWALLSRWLASRRAPICGTNGESCLPWYSALGIELYIEADYEPFEGDGNIQNGVPKGEAIVRIFGRRNLFPTRFNRGDANGDGILNISDAIRILGYLFLGDSETACPDAFDADDDGSLTITDAVRLLGHLFLGQEALPVPYNSCDPDPTPDDGMGCWESTCPIVP